MTTEEELELSQSDAAERDARRNGDQHAREMIADLMR